MAIGRQPEMFQHQQCHGAQCDGANRLSDVLIIGGGPAGSTAAILLRHLGHQVTLLEKEHHPRFHIGESLLPANLPLFERLGVAKEISAIGMVKRGAEFVSPWHGRGETFEFSESWDCSQSYAYQVCRSDFDQILIRRAEHVGAEVIEGCCVQRVEFLAPGSGVLIHATHDDGRSDSWRARYVIDASGRDTLLSKQLHIKTRNSKHSSAAMFAHFLGATRGTDKHAGNISIFWFDHGWLWLIPLADGATSVGAVVWPYYLKRRSSTLQEFFLKTIELCPALAGRLKDAKLSTVVRATGNYSYSSRYSHGDNYMLLGDAYTFIDPMFSSGVWLAMHSAVAGVEAVDVCLRAPQNSAAAFNKFDRDMRHGPETFSWFIYRITKPAMRDLFMNPNNRLRMKEAILSVLSGDIFDKTPIWRSLRIFKIVYRIASLIDFRRSVAAVRLRRRNIRVESLEQPAAVG